MDRDTYYEQISEAARFLLDAAPHSPVLGMVLGSGLGAFADTVTDLKIVDYDAIPGFPVSTVKGHAGRLIFGRVKGIPLVVLSGRAHLYEGHSPDMVVFPARVLAKMGVKAMVFTNAAGAANPDFSPGDLMLITDHLNMTGSNPLHGGNDDRLGPRFPDMSEAYDRDLRGRMEAASVEAGVSLRHGVYAGLLGPSYETPAEVRMLRAMGADAIGMSTVLEVIAARHMGVRSVGVSCITNMGAGLAKSALNHKEVEEVANRVRAQFVSLLGAFVGRLGDLKEG